MRGSWLLAAACAVALVACSKPPAAKGPSWAEFAQKFEDGYFERNPHFAVNQGKHAFDGKLPDWSEAGLASQISFLKEEIAAAEAFPVAGLSEDEKFERDYLLARARGDLFWRETADQPHTNPAFYLEALDPSVYIARPYAAPDVRLKAYIAFLQNWPKAAEQIKANLKAPLPKVFVSYGEKAFGGFAEYFPGDGKAAFAAVQDPALQQQLSEASDAAAKAAADLAAWVKAQEPQAGENFALGAERFAQMLRDTELVDVPLDQLQAIGQADLKRNQGALKEACAAFAPKASIEACVAKANADKPKGGVVEAARGQLAGLKQFIQDKDLVSIPGTEEAQVDEAPPYNRQNFAYINIPGPYETGLPSVYNIAPPDPTWPKAVQDGFVPGQSDLLFTSVHEVWPGHFLQFLHANRVKSQFGKVFVGYAFAEGWAHYTEEMMWDAGLGDGAPEIHIGQLSNALLRNCRFLSAIGLHSGTMTLEQSRQLFRTECHQDEGNSRQQAARGAYDPAYLNYTLGKLMIRKLREDWTASHGGRAAWKPFHDEFLSFGGPPIPLVRAKMMGEAEPKAVF